MRCRPGHMTEPGGTSTLNGPGPYHLHPKARPRPGASPPPLSAGRRIEADIEAFLVGDQDLLVRVAKPESGERDLGAQKPPRHVAQVQVRAVSRGDRTMLRTRPFRNNTPSPMPRCVLFLGGAISNHCRRHATTSIVEPLLEPDPPYRNVTPLLDKHAPTHPHREQPGPLYAEHRHVHHVATSSQMRQRSRGGHLILVFRHPRKTTSSNGAALVPTPAAASRNR